MIVKYSELRKLNSGDITPIKLSCPDKLFRLICKHYRFALILSCSVESNQYDNVEVMELTNPPSNTDDKVSILFGSST